MVSGTTWFSMPLPAPITGAAMTGHDDPVSPVELNSVLPSIAACFSTASACGCRLFPSPSITGSGSVESGPPVIGLVGLVSHSPNDAFACIGPFASSVHCWNIFSTSASDRLEPK